jgi:hypothetical protein
MFVFRRVCLLSEQLALFLYWCEELLALSFLNWSLYTFFCLIEKKDLLSKQFVADREQWLKRIHWSLVFTLQSTIFSLERCLLSFVFCLLSFVFRLSSLVFRLSSFVVGRRSFVFRLSSSVFGLRLGLSRTLRVGLGLVSMSASLCCHFHVCCIYTYCRSENAFHQSKQHILSLEHEVSSCFVLPWLDLSRLVLPSLDLFCLVSSYLDLTWLVDNS